jgi:hypothetical protein
VLTHSELVVLEKAKVDKEAMAKFGCERLGAAHGLYRSDLLTFLTFEARGARLHDDFKSTESGYS